MAYVGNTPADKTLKLEKQQFTTSATTSYTLSHSVSDPQDIALFINNVRQNPNSSYTVSGTALTLSAATASTDTMYCVFLGRAIGTVGIGAGSVTKDKVDFISDGTGSGVISKGDGSSIDGSIQLNCHVNSHGIKLKSPPHSAGQSYTLTFPSTAPVNGKVLQTDGSGNLSFADGNLAASCSFAAYMNSGVTNIAADSLVSLPFDTEFFDVGSNFNTSTYTFTAPATGYYLFNTYIRLNNNNRDMNYIMFRLVTTAREYERNIWDPNAFYNDVTYWSMNSTDYVYLSSGNTVTPKYYQGGGSANVDIPSGAGQSMFSGMRIA